MSKSQGRPVRLCHMDIVRWTRGVLRTSTCHVWMGAVGGDGYGRIAVTNKYDGERMLTPHQIGAVLKNGPIPVGATLLHDCEVRLCCRAEPGHVRIGTQAENIQDAVRRGRAAGPRPGRVDVRGAAGASRAIQAALSHAAEAGRSVDELAAVLAAVIAEGDPLRDLIPMFPAPALRAAGDRTPDRIPPAPASASAAQARRRTAEPVQTWPLF